MHGMTIGKLEFSQYDPLWPDLFESEKKRIAENLSVPLTAIEHIGSTAVPGLLSKPVIDIALTFSIAADFGSIKQSLVGAGYDYRGLHTGQSHWYFVYNRDGKRLYHVHLWNLPDPDYNRHIAFRDCLRKNPAAAAEYARLKFDWAEQVGWNKLHYSLSKDGFVNQILGMAKGK